MKITVHSEPDHGYSPDVEIDHDGRVKWARDVEKGEVIAVPLHMMERVARQSQPHD